MQEHLLDLPTDLQRQSQLEQYESEMTRRIAAAHDEKVHNDQLGPAPPRRGLQAQVFDAVRAAPAPLQAGGIARALSRPLDKQLRSAICTLVHRGLLVKNLDAYQVAR